jgi:hypothetical protein
MDSAARAVPKTSKRVGARRQRTRLSAAAERVKRNGKIGSKCRTPTLIGVTSDNTE